MRDAAEQPRVLARIREYDHPPEMAAANSRIEGPAKALIIGVVAARRFMHAFIDRDPQEWCAEQCAKQGIHGRVLADRPEGRMLVQWHEAAARMSATGGGIGQSDAPGIDGIAGGQAQLDRHYPGDKCDAVVQERRADWLQRARCKITRIVWSRIHGTLPHARSRRVPGASRCASVY